MATHLAGWYESLDPAGVATPIKAMLDERLFALGDNIRVNKLQEVIGIGVVVTTAANTAAEAYLYSPSLDVLGQSYITPLNVGTAPAVNDTYIRWADFSAHPLKLRYDELSRLYINANPAADAVQAGFILFSDGNTMTIPAGRHIKYRGTFVAPSVAGQWSPVDIEWQKELVPGNYGVTGMRVVAPTTLAARLNARSNPAWLPGVMVSPTYETIAPMYTQSGQSGIWLTFPFTQTPTLEVCATTPAAGTLYLDIVQLSDESNPR